MEYFNIYLNAFKNMTDYKNPAKRKDFNFFMLFYFIFWILIFFPLMFLSVPYFVISNKGPENLFIIFFVVSWLFFIIHGVPLIALIKRRLIDIIPSKADLIFWLFIILEIIRIFISLFFTIFLFKSNGQFHIWYFLVGFINQILSTISLVFIVFLMVKKGIKDI